MILKLCNIKLIRFLFSSSGSHVVILITAEKVSNIFFIIFSMFEAYVRYLQIHSHSIIPAIYKIFSVFYESLNKCWFFKCFHVANTEVEKRKKAPLSAGIHAILLRNISLWFIMHFFQNYDICFSSQLKNKNLNFFPLLTVIWRFHVRKWKEKAHQTFPIKQFFFVLIIFCCNFKLSS